MHHGAVIIGTRPEAVKLAPVVRELRSRGHVTVIATGQHREMVAEILELFEVAVDVQLDVMRPGSTLGGLTARLTKQLDKVFRSGDFDPEWVIVQGDTTTAMVGALVAFYHKKRVAHVEAGLRTFDRWAPFPEETNRTIVGQIADLHFAPTERCAENLRREGIQDPRIFVTGNTVVDAVEWMRGRVASTFSKEFPEELPEWIGEFIDGKRLLLVTAHRRESQGAGLEAMCDGVLGCLERDTDARVIFPVHPSPQVREVVLRKLARHPQCMLFDPLGYESMLWLLSRCDVVLTDSGGLQEEAPSFGKPVVILRESTERPEVIESGFGKLAGTDPKRIMELVTAATESAEWRESIAGRPNPFGDGCAAGYICDALESWMDGNDDLRECRVGEPVYHSQHPLRME